MRGIEVNGFDLRKGGKVLGFCVESGSLIGGRGKTPTTELAVYS